MSLYYRVVGATVHIRKITLLKYAWDALYKLKKQEKNLNSGFKDGDVIYSTVNPKSAAMRVSGLYIQHVTAIFPLLTLPSLRTLRYYQSEVPRET